MNNRCSWLFFLILFFNTIFAQQTFTWNTYTVQTFSGTITNSCVNMEWSVTTSGTPNWANSTPKYANSVVDGTGLKMNVNWDNQTSIVTLTLNFKEGATTIGTPLSFSIYNVNSSTSAAGSKFIDSIRVTGTTLANVVVNPNSMTTDSDNQLVSPSVKGSSSGVDNPENTTNISFSTAVKQVIITYYSGKKFIGDANSTFFNPTAQYITIGSITTNYTCPTAPVQLLNFKANCVNNNVQLNWQTASESNNDYFDIERSTDGLSYANFLRVNGNGNTNEQQNYTAYDEQPLTGTNYYRLKQVDFNGATTYYNPVMVNCADDANISIYPNPNYGNFLIKGLQEESELQLTDALGKNLLTKNVSATETTYEVTTLQEGIYFLLIKTKLGLVQTQKIIVQK